MFKVLIMLFIAIKVNAKVITVITTGTYEDEKFTHKSHIPDETKFARQQALAFAKQNASEEAGTTIYTSYSSHFNSKGREDIKSEIKAISSALVTYKIIKEGWEANKYIVKIKAKVDTKDTEEIFNKADARLEKIIELQRTNEEILADIKAIAEKISVLNRDKYISKNTREIKKINTQITKEQKNQSKLMDDYELNAYLMVTTFKKGTLLAIADRNDAEFERGKKAFDRYIIEPFKSRFNVKLLNIDVVRNGTTADITFILGVNVKKHLGFSSKIRPWFDGQKIGTDIYRAGAGYNILVFNDKGGTKKLKKWIEKNRNIVVRVNIGKRTYITEPIAYYTDEYVRIDTRHTEKAGYRGGYKIFNNTIGYLSFRTMKNIPIAELNDLEEMRANLVFSSRNIKNSRDRDGEFELKLPSVREASEYYR